MRRRFNPHSRQPASSKRKRMLRLESLEARQLLAADSIGVTPVDTGEILVGRVLVTPVFFESNGGIDPETQNWTAEEIDEVLAKLTEGVNWWSRALDQLNTVHTLEFVIDDTYARNPVSTPFEPIDNTSNQINRPIGDFLTDAGYGDSRSIEEAVRRFNHDQRIRPEFQADWAFSIFVADSSDDPDERFASGGDFGAAFAYPGGALYVSPSTRPASTFAHELGHIFWARDQYPGGGSWTDRRGYYNAQNFNASDNPTPGFVQQDSILLGGVPLNRAYESLFSSEDTLAMVGWRDSDGDGVFDFADVPLSLDGVGSFDPETSTYRFQGRAEVVPLRNLNSSGPQSDIALGIVDRLEYRLDGGPWTTAAQVDAQRADVEAEFQIDAPFDQIELRVVDGTGIVFSPTLQGTATLPALPGGGIRGVAFFDDNGNGVFDEGEVPRVGHTVHIQHADGRSLYQASIDADLLDEGDVPAGVTDGLSLSASGSVSRNGLGVFVGDDSAEKLFHSYDTQWETWTSRFDSNVSLVASLDQPVGRATITAGGLDAGSFARVAAYDADGNFLTRVTSDVIVDGQKTEVTINDPLGRIEQLRIFGHADTAITVSKIDVGLSGQLQTDAAGSWQLTNLPAGNYTIDIMSDLVVEDYLSLPDQISVGQVAIEQLDGEQLDGGLASISLGTSDLIVAAATSVNSPRHNLESPANVDRLGEVTVLDALEVINDLARLGSRTLSADETEGLAIDVNNDGMATALDALLVINQISRNQSGLVPEAEATEAEPDRLSTSAQHDAVLSDWQTQPDLDAVGDRLPAAQRDVPLVQIAAVQTDLSVRNLDANELESDSDVQQIRDQTGAQNLTPRISVSQQVVNSAGDDTSDESIGFESADETDGADHAALNVFGTSIRRAEPLR